MKVSKLIALLEKCSLDADVSLVLNGDDLLDGCELNDVLEIMFHKDGFANTVVLKT